MPAKTLRASLISFPNFNQMPKDSNMSGEVFLRELYGKTPKLAVRTNYNRIEKMVAGHEGEPIMAVVGNYTESLDFQQSGRWVNHSYNNRFEIGLLTSDQVQYQSAPPKSWLNVVGVKVYGPYNRGVIKTEPVDEIVLTARPTAHSRGVSRRDAGLRLGNGNFKRRNADFPRDVITRNPETPALRPHIELVVGASAIEAFMQSPGIGSLESTHLQLDYALEELGITL